MANLGSGLKVTFNDVKEMKPVVTTPVTKPPSFKNNVLVNNKNKGRLKPAFSSKLKDNSPYNER